MRSSRDGSSLRTTLSTCGTSTSKLLSTDYADSYSILCNLWMAFAISLHFKSIKTYRFPLPNSRFPSSDVHLLFSILNPGNVGEQQSTPAPGFIFDNHSIN